MCSCCHGAVDSKLEFSPCLATLQPFPVRRHIHLRVPQTDCLDCLWRPVVIARWWKSETSTLSDAKLLEISIWHPTHSRRKCLPIDPLRISTAPYMMVTVPNLVQCCWRSSVPCVHCNQCNPCKCETEEKCSSNQESTVSTSSQQQHYTPICTPFER